MKRKTNPLRRRQSQESNSKSTSSRELSNPNKKVTKKLVKQECSLDQNNELEAAGTSVYHHHSASVNAHSSSIHSNDTLLKRGILKPSIVVGGPNLPSIKLLSNPYINEEASFDNTSIGEIPVDSSQHHHFSMGKVTLKLPTSNSALPRLSPIYNQTDHSDDIMNFVSSTS